MYYNNDVSLCSNLDKLIKPSSVKVISDDSSEKSDIVLEPL
ncbi:DNA-directed RNA polymerase, alpha subunit, partial [Wolbachia endosymbiont of Drosophila ananassae]